MSAVDEELLRVGQECLYDPLAWVMAVFPWGERGTFLERYPEGPDEWQTEMLIAVGEELYAAAHGIDGKSTAQLAIGAGHGVGKSAVASWLILFFMSTRPNPAAVVTAGTATQLSTKLWRELKKWLDVSSVAHWFDWLATSLKLKSDREKWVANAIPWSESNPHAFAGTHEENVLMLFDEGSTIADIIYETAEGAFTTPGGMWIVFGNRTASSGKFNGFFTKPSKFWRTMIVDARRARMANKAKIEEWKQTYGEDSDFFRVRVMGLAPKGGDTRIITVEDIEAAVLREMHEEWISTTVPLVMGIDPAGGGASRSAIVMRKGPLVKEEWIIRFSESNQMRVASLIAGYLSKFKPDYAFIDAHGIGKPIYDRLVQLGYFQIIPVYGGDVSAVQEKLRFYNPRAEMWGRMADWLKVSHIPDDRELRDELLAQPMDRDSRNRLVLMSKQEMREKGIASPDTADALGYTFAELVSAKPGSDEEHHQATPEVA
jgi:hypothetical protein